MTWSSPYLHRLRVTLPIALICFALGLSFGCLSDPAEADPPSDDEDAGVEEDTGVDEDASMDGDVCEAVSCDDEELEGQCGEIDDGCGNTIECGCGGNEVCGAEEGEAGACVCISEWFCEEHGAECGILAVPEDETCGDKEEVDCGNCSSPEECWEPDDIDEADMEGDIEPYTCECIPESCEDLGYECGMVFDNCGVEIDCDSEVDAPTCQGSENAECIDGHWECVAEECEPDTTCDDVECGTFTDECGDVHTCGDGACSDFQTCNDAENQCQCDDDLMENHCGPNDCTVDDGECSFDCVECSENCECDGGQCVPDGTVTGINCVVLD